MMTRTIRSLFWSCFLIMVVVVSRLVSCSSVPTISDASVCVGECSVEDLEDDTIDVVSVQVGGNIQKELSMDHEESDSQPLTLPPLQLPLPPLSLPLSRPFSSSSSSSSSLPTSTPVSQPLGISRYILVSTVWGLGVFNTYLYFSHYR